MTQQIPLVDYLVLGERPHLVANTCRSCGARFFVRRNACASCFGTSFEKVDIEPTGEVRAFTIVSQAAPGIDVPFVSALIDCAGTSVRGNVIGIEPDPDNLRLGMQVKLKTYSLGMDDRGNEAIGFGFEPTT